MKLILTLLGVVLLVVAGVYFLVPADQLPGFFPGHEAGVTRMHTKHGMVAAVAGPVLRAAGVGGGASGRMGPERKLLQAQARIPAAGIAPEWCMTFPLKKKRAQETPGASRTRSLVCEMNKTHEHGHHRLGRIHPAFPAQWF